MSPLLLDWHLAWPWLLLALPLPLLAQRWLVPAGGTGSAALRTPFADRLEALQVQGAAAARPRWPISLLLAWLLLCLAAARPQQLGAADQPPRSGRDLLLAVDLSGSMAEQDMALGRQLVDRLTAAKAVLGDFLERRRGDRVGLLLFGQRAYAVTPLTFDRGSVRQQLQDSEVGLAGQETAIGDAIGLAVKRLGAAPAVPAEGPAASGQRVLILLTDGVNTAGALKPDQAAQLAEAAGLRVHTIGFGGSGQAGLFGLARAPQIDEATLRAIAERTGGRYFRARDTRELAGIYAELDRLEPAAQEGAMQRPRHERYAWPLAAALLFGLLAALPRPAWGVR